MIDPAACRAETRSPRPRLACVIRADKRWRAQCSCGELAVRPRLWRAMAIQDAQLHAVSAGCDLSSPLVIPYRGLHAACVATLKRGSTSDRPRFRPE
jgi:hypothetical protein